MTPYYLYKDLGMGMFLYADIVFSTVYTLSQLNNLITALYFDNVNISKALYVEDLRNLHMHNIPIVIILLKIILYQNNIQDRAIFYYFWDIIHLLLSTNKCTL